MTPGTYARAENRSAGRLRRGSRASRAFLSPAHGRLRGSRVRGHQAAGPRSDAATPGAAGPSQRFCPRATSHADGARRHTGGVDARGALSFRSRWPKRCGTSHPICCCQTRHGQRTRCWAEDEPPLRRAVLVGLTTNGTRLCSGAATRIDQRGTYFSHFGQRCPELGACDIDPPRSKRDRRRRRQCAARRVRDAAPQRSSAANIPMP